MQAPDSKKLKFDKVAIVQLSAVAALSILILGWRLVPGKPTLVNQLYRDLGYWAMLGLFVLTILAWFRFWRPRFLGPKVWLKTHAIGLAIAIGGGVLFQLHEPRQFKVLFDEYGFSGIAYDMHYSRQATFPSRAHYIEGRMYILNHGIDKRPVLYPFLISVVSDLTGYRPENALYLNAFLGGALLFFIYLLADVWQCREGGWAAQLILIGLPLIAQNATGGGYDLANLTFLTLFPIAATAYLRSAGTRGLDALVSITIVLAQLRYESILFTIACAILVLYKWWRTRNVRLTWMSVALVAFIAFPIVVNKIANSEPGYFENKAGQPIASLSYFVGNISHAIFYLYDIALGSSNYPLLSYVGTIAFFFVFVRLGKLIFTKRPLDPQLVVIALVGLICLINTVVMMCWFWASWDDPMASRFSLIIQFAFLLSIIWLVKNIQLRWKISPLALTSLGLISLGWCIPASASATATRNISVGSEFQFFLSNLKARPAEKTLIVGPGFIGAIVYGYPAIATLYANAAPWKINLILQNHHYDEVLAIQRIMLDPKTLAPAPDVLTKLSDDFILETVSEKKLRPDVITRIVRIVGVKPNKAWFPNDEMRGPPFASTYDLVVDALAKLP